MSQEGWPAGRPFRVACSARVDRAPLEAGQRRLVKRRCRRPAATLELLAAAAGAGFVATDLVAFVVCGGWRRERVFAAVPEVVHPHELDRQGVDKFFAQFEVDV